MNTLYCDALKGAEKYLFVHSENDRIPYVGDYNSRRSHNIMHHLSCFLPGLLTLGVKENACESTDDDLTMAYKIM